MMRSIFSFPESDPFRDLVDNLGDITWWKSPKELQRCDLNGVLVHEPQDYLEFVPQSSAI